MPDFVPVDHPRFRRAQRDLFIARVTRDCMSHRCRLLAVGDREKLDACCQYGVDVDLSERDNILSRRDQIAAILSDEVATMPWFSEIETKDADFASGAYVRTRTADKGCLFLSHDLRGCAIHRASLEGGWDFRGTKPHVCRLFPVSYESDAIVLSDDYIDYSCSLDRDAPTVYRVARADLGEIFGVELIAALDVAEASVHPEPVPLVQLRA